MANYLDKVQFNERTTEHGCQIVGGCSLLKEWSVPVGLVLNPSTQFANYSSDRPTLISDDLFDKLFNETTIQNKRKSKRQHCTVSMRKSRKSFR